jgi:DNA-binding NarL/FixJ family response regulator
MSELRVALVDDHVLLRAGLVAMVEYEDDICIVGEASNGCEAIELYDRVLPDIMVMDITMPKMGGIEASKAILSKHPDACILVMTQHEERQFIEEVMKVEVSGCISKRAAGDEFVSALRAVARGEFYLHPALTHFVVPRGKKFVDPFETLTPRERQVLKAVVCGDTNGAMARTLNLSIKTVEWHRSNLMTKLGVHSTADLVRFAMEHGFNVKDEKPIDRI